MGWRTSFNPQEGIRLLPHDVLGAISVGAVRAVSIPKRGLGYFHERSTDLLSLETERVSIPKRGLGYFHKAKFTPEFVKRIEESFNPQEGIRLLPHGAIGGLKQTVDGFVSIPTRGLGYFHALH